MVSNEMNFINNEKDGEVSNRPHLRSSHLQRKCCQNVLDHNEVSDFFDNFKSKDRTVLDFALPKNKNQLRLNIKP